MAYAVAVTRENGETTPLIGEDGEGHSFGIIADRAEAQREADQLQRVIEGYSGPHHEAPGERIVRASVVELPA